MLRLSLLTPLTDLLGVAPDSLLHSTRVLVQNIYELKTFQTSPNMHNMSHLQFHLQPDIEENYAAAGETRAWHSS